MEIIDFKNKIDNKKLKQVAKCIKYGGIIAFPTETVYGIGANALDKNAVDKIYKIKERNKDKPLIVLVSSMEMLNSIVKNINHIHKKLIDNFWPGSLTILFEKKSVLPDNVTAGLDTIAVRIPGNEIALKLICNIGVPITAPSANLSGKLSIIDANVVCEQLKDKVDFVIDGGISGSGIESTIVKVEDGIVKILRSGKIRKEDIEKIGLKVVQYDNNIYNHYDIGKELIMVSGDEISFNEKINSYLKMDNIKSVGIISSEKYYNNINFKVDKYISIDEDCSVVLKNLFNTLNDISNMDVDTFFIQSFDDNKIGSIISDKIREIKNIKFI